MVYLPYTHEWDPRTHSLIEMVVAMSSVFSADPPVFTRAAPLSPPSPPPPDYSSYVSSSNAVGSQSLKNYVSSSNVMGSTSSQSVNNKRRSTTTKESERQIRDQLTAIMAKEAEEANLASEIARKAEKEEMEREKQITAQKEWEKRKLEQTRIEVNQKVRSYLQNYTEKTKSTLFADWRDQERLQENKNCLDNKMEDLKKQKSTLTQHVATIDAKTEEIESWLKESESAKAEERDINDICIPVTKVDAQMLELSAENAALTDTMYFLDRGMYTGQIDCTTHLKIVRKLAKRQFLIRAHLIKINQVIGNSKY